jgi:hypothetical protein
MEFLKSERLIDGVNEIYIGVIEKNNSNPYSSQAIKIGLDGKIKRLEKFIETNNNLIYEYESGTSMTLTKKNNDIIIHIFDPETSTKIIKQMDLIVREIFKPIRWYELTEEYNLIEKFIALDYENNQLKLSNEINSNEINSNEINSNEINSNEINSNEINSNEINSNIMER